VIDLDKLGAWMDDEGLPGKGDHAQLHHGRFAERDLRDPAR
jgi:hypothetical protein